MKGAWPVFKFPSGWTSWSACIRTSTGTIQEQEQNQDQSYCYQDKDSKIVETTVDTEIQDSVK